jgi:hypothetical protein
MSLWDAFRTSVLTPVKEVLVPKTFKPVFYEDIYVVDGDGLPLSKVNPVYCATLETTTKLADILADMKPVMVARDPLRFAQDSPFSLNKAWFLEFPGKRVANAGLLAAYWLNHSYADAERMAREEITHLQPAA